MNNDYAEPLLDKVSDILDDLFPDCGFVLILADPGDGMVHWTTNLVDDLVPTLLRSTAEQADAKAEREEGAGEGLGDRNPIG